MKDKQKTLQIKITQENDVYIEIYYNQFYCQQSKNETQVEKSIDVKIIQEKDLSINESYFDQSKMNTKQKVSR